MELHYHETTLSDCKKWFSRIVQHLNRSKCIEIAKKNVSLVHINAMNTFAVVPSADDNGSTKDYLNALEKYCY